MRVAGWAEKRGQAKRQIKRDSAYTAKAIREYIGSLEFEHVVNIRENYPDADQLIRLVRKQGMSAFREDYEIVGVVDRVIECVAWDPL